MATIAQWDSGALPNIDGTAPTVSGTKFTTATGTVSAGWWGFTAVNQWSLRFYVSLPATWASAAGPLAVAGVGAGTNACRAVLAGTGNPGQVRLIRSANAQQAASSNGTVSGSVTYRFELQANGSAGTLKMGVFPLGSDIALWDSGEQSGATATGINRLYVGNGKTGAVPAANAGPYEFSHVLATDTYGSWLGRDASDPLTPSAGVEVLGTWGGSGILAATILGIWNGSGVDSATAISINGG